MRTDAEVTRYEAPYSMSRFQHLKSRVSRQAVARVTFACDIAIYVFCSSVHGVGMGITHISPELESSTSVRGGSMNSTQTSPELGSRWDYTKLRWIVCEYVCVLYIIITTFDAK